MKILSRGEKVLAFIVGLLALLVVAALGFRMFFVTFVDNYELGYAYDTRTGKITILKETGYQKTIPFLVTVHTIDLRPMQVCINANKRVLNCKLVQFNPEGIELFLSWHGRDSYANCNGHGNSPGSVALDEILKSYAFDGSGKSYPFLTVLRELSTDQANTGEKK